MSYIVIPSSFVIIKVLFTYYVIMFLMIIVGILVFWLLGRMFYLFIDGANVTVSATTKHTLFEILCTALPSLLLLVFVKLSFRVLYLSDDY